MPLIARLQSSRFLSVAVFGEHRAAAFPAGSVGAEGFARIRALSLQLDAASADQQAAKNELGADTTDKEAAFLTIRGLVKNIADTAPLMGAAQGRDFARPTNEAEGTFVASASAFLPRLTAPVVTEFVRYGLAANFKTQLESALSTYNAARDDQSDGTGEKASETADVYATINEGVALIKVLDRVVKNVFGADKTTMALWAQAKRLDEDHAHRATTTAV